MLRTPSTVTGSSAMALPSVSPSGAAPLTTTELSFAKRKERPAGSSSRCRPAPAVMSPNSPSVLSPARSWLLKTTWMPVCLEKVISAVARSCAGMAKFHCLSAWATERAAFGAAPGALVCPFAMPSATPLSAPVVSAAFAATTGVSSAVTSAVVARSRPRRRSFACGASRSAPASPVSIFPMPRLSSILCNSKKRWSRAVPHRAGSIPMLMRARRIRIIAMESTAGRGAYLTGAVRLFAAPRGSPIAGRSGKG